MRPIHEIPTVALVAVLCSATAAAQTLLPRPHLPVHEEQIGEHTELWACGNDYKVRLDDGITFIPRLGRGAAQNAEFHWRTSGLSDRLGNTLPASAQAAPQPRGFCTEIAHGWARECYDVLDEGLEQSFVFAERPPLAGDLELRGAVAGNLVGERTAPRHASLRFSDAAGNAVVAYGAAFAIDRTGVRRPLQTCFAGGEIRIQLPAELLATACYPLVVDPLLTPQLLAASSPSLRWQSQALAVTPSPTAHPTGQAMLLFTSASDSDVYLEVYGDDLTAGGVGLFGVFSNSTSEEHADLTASDAGTRWLLVFDRAGASAPLFHCVHDVANQASNFAYYPLAAPAGSHETLPRLGGSFSGSSKNVLVVREQHGSGSSVGRVVASLLDVRTLHETTPFQLSSSLLFTAAGQPAVSKDAAGVYWLCAWQSSSTLAPGFRVQARRVDVFGNVSAASFASDRTALPVHEIAPRIDGAFGHYTLTWGEVDRITYPSLIAGDESMSLRAMRVDWPLFAAAPTTLPSQELVSRSTRTLRACDTAFDTRTRSHWFLGFQDLATQDLRIAVTGMTGRSLRQEVVHAASATAHGTGLALSFVPADWLARAIYSVTSPTSESLFMSGAAHPDNPVTLYGAPSCSAATNAVTGRFLRGNQFAAIELDGAAPNQLAVLFLGAAPTAVPLAGLGLPGCSAVVDIGGGLIAAPMGITSAAGRLEQQIPLPETLPTFDLFAQWLYLSPPANAFGALTTYGLQLRVR
ncbi:MAG TPA: hypothetical protein VFZ65_07370 [Planctomycetota bacterium]|nr:hypothetical protein [Planctomycetota bacterium]